jgi:hypothetical protein
VELSSSDDDSDTVPGSHSNQRAKIHRNDSEQDGHQDPADNADADQFDVQSDIEPDCALDKTTRTSETHSKPRREPSQTRDGELQEAQAADESSESLDSSIPPIAISSSADQSDKPTWPCPEAKKYSCDKRFISRGSAYTHLKNFHNKLEWPCPRAGCSAVFTSKHTAERHAANPRHDEKKKRKGMSTLTPEERVPCLTAAETGCKKTFATRVGARQH